MDITRKAFMRGTAISGAAIALSALTGCKGAAKASSNGSNNQTEIVASDFVDADIVVVGGGMSGLSATVSAASEGKSVVLIEANTALGGNGTGTEGVFACGSSLQKAAGIEFSFEDIISEELSFFNYRIDALSWKDLVNASADNITWLMNQGVTFSAVDNYHGQGKFAGFHWFAGSSKDGYIDPMSTKVNELGVNVLLGSRARELLMADGRISGIIAETSNGSYTQINCSAVILASGGYCDNDEKMVEVGVDLSTLTRKGFPHHQGDGLDMALSVGGVDSRMKHCVMREPGCQGYAFESALGAMGLHNGGPFVFVNGNGERYTNENCIAQNQANAANCILSQRKSYAVVNDAVLQWLDQNTAPGIAAAAADAIDKGAEVYKADTLEALAKNIGVDPNTLVETFARYNSQCTTAHDEDFGKDASMMKSMSTGPFWAFRHGFFYFSTVGGIRTSRRFEVLGTDYEPIPGLWAVGTDGCELYRESYTVMVPGSCNANNVNSGRTAGANAAAYVG
jgi:fumarate reductase flavoprotein subunit